MCGGRKHILVFRYDAPPAGENRFACFMGRRYRRDVWRCMNCGHFVSRLNVSLDRLYEGEYVGSLYGDTGLACAYERIMALPPEQSDNWQRVRRIINFMDTQASLGRSPTLLDVGSGLAVFPARMKAEGWSCTVLDPDRRAVAHARRRVGVRAVSGDYMIATRLGRYDLVTFNKILEHVPNPLAMLRKSRDNLRSGGVVYVEVPDGEMAMHDGPGREEFFIEHRCVFSFASLALLARKSGFVARLIERLREPSGKYTLRAFLTLRSGRPVTTSMVVKKRKSCKA